MNKKMELSAEDREMTIGFANNILPLAFEDVMDVIEHDKRTVIQKFHMSEDGSTGMVNIRVRNGQEFSLDVYVASNKVHGKSFHVHASKSEKQVEAYVEGTSDETLEILATDAIPAVEAFLALFENEAMTLQVDVDQLLSQMTEQYRNDLIDSYLASGDFDKIIALQNQTSLQ